MRPARFSNLISERGPTARPSIFSASVCTCADSLLTVSLDATCADISRNVVSERSSCCIVAGFLSATIKSIFCVRVLIDSL
jgi:hypothetical protein